MNHAVLPDASQQGCLKKGPRKYIVPAGGKKSKDHHHLETCVSLTLHFGGWINKVILVLEITSGRDCSGGIGGIKRTKEEKTESMIKGNISVWIRS